MSPQPQAGELWCYKKNPSLMVLILKIAHSNQLVLTRNLFRSQSIEPLDEGWRGMETFQSAWEPITQETK